MVCHLLYSYSPGDADTILMTIRERASNEWISLSLAKATQVSERSNRLPGFETGPNRERVRHANYLTSYVEYMKRGTTHIRYLYEGLSRIFKILLNDIMDAELDNNRLEQHLTI